MDIYSQIKKWIGKITVILIMVVFPFIMHDKLNDVTITRYRFFIAVAALGFVCMLVITVFFCIGSFDKIMDWFLMTALCLVLGQIMNWCEKIFPLNPRELDGAAMYMKSSKTMVVGIVFCVCYVAIIYFQDGIRKYFSQ